MSLTADRSLTAPRSWRNQTKRLLLCICSLLSGVTEAPFWVQESPRWAQEVQFISPKICDLTSKSHASLTLSLISSFSTSVHLLPSFPSPSSPSSPSPRVRPQRKFIGGGGMPVEVKRVSGSPSASPIILYGWSSGGAFITLNYTLRLLPLPPGPCRTALALSSYHLTQEERNAGNSWYIAQHLPSTWLHCGSLNFTSSHPHSVMYVVYGWDHRHICGEPKWAAEAYCLMRAWACLEDPRRMYSLHWIRLTDAHMIGNDNIVPVVLEWKHASVLFPVTTSQL